MKYSNEVYKQLNNIVPKNVSPVVVCIGTDRSTGDSYAPLIGSMLRKSRIPVYGTIDEPVHAVNLRESIEKIVEKHNNPYIIAVDACLGIFDHVGRIQVDNEPLRPGAGVNKDLGEVGNCSVKGIVNVSGFMEYFVLSNTRLSIVMEMANETAAGIKKFYRNRTKNKNNIKHKDVIL